MYLFLSFSPLEREANIRVAPYALAPSNAEGRFFQCRSSVFHRALLVGFLGFGVPFIDSPPWRRATLVIDALLINFNQQQ